MTKVKKQEKIVKLLSSKKYILLDEENNHEYDIIKEEYGDSNYLYETISLYYSNNSNTWTSLVRGKLTLQMIIKDDDITFDKSINKLDYGSVDHVRILLKFIEDIKYKLIEDKSIKQL